MTTAPRNPTVDRLMVYPTLDLVGQAEDLIRDDLIVLERPITGTRLLAIFAGDEPIRFHWADGNALADLAPLDGTALLHLTSLREVLRKVAGGVTENDQVVFDGELLPSGDFHLLDVPYVQFGDVPILKPTAPYVMRRAVLDAPDTGIAIAGTPVCVRSQATTRRAKTNLLQEIRVTGGRTVLARHLYGSYVSGHLSPSVATLRFVHTAHLVVMATVRSGFEDGYAGASLGAFTDEHELREVARVTYPTSEPVVATDVVEVSYLHWTGRTLYRPQFESILIGADRMDCTIGQFPDYTRETFTFPIHESEQPQP